ncbi:hypothetical protein CPC08DRAFT_317566 [Agrocybe pediades]|nr:hypothetical protein CPC08DRAFT_317566 [Agrocybe pediades]
MLAMYLWTAEVGLKVASEVVRRFSSTREQKTTHTSSTTRSNQTSVHALRTSALSCFQALILSVQFGLMLMLNGEPNISDAFVILLLVAHLPLYFLSLPLPPRGPKPGLRAADKIYAFNDTYLESQ